MAIQSLSRDELRAILKCAREHRERDWLMILVAFSHGLRRSEVVAIKADDIRDGFLAVARRKGSHRTVQPLFGSEDALFDERAGLFEFARGLAGNQRLFPVSAHHFWRLFRGYALAADIPAHKAHPHVLKHTIAMQVIHSAGIENTKQYLGHKSMNSTGAYLKVSDDEASAAVGKALKG